LTTYAGIEEISAAIKLTVNHETQEILQLVLEPELTHRVSPRSSIKVDSINGKFRIRVKGRDLSSFRASVTSIFRLLHVVIEVQRIVHNHSY
jgi:tRNA threonylcarbamoyladenosine modification (KEOPS) complex  Pcc1 subunit